MSPLPAATMLRVLFAYGRIRGGVVQLQVVPAPPAPAPVEAPVTPAAWLSVAPAPTSTLGATIE